ncbi:protocadherin-8-like isoform X2 [Hyla sarda]|uniref:protocadherin-8-like isoform X2 n=1 Tax=Hyla sarda TaxID=327740 RepID=UPI0024C2661A|nr:protocadherin-8-like isoform X2 [Hyla sarda]
MLGVSAVTPVLLLGLYSTLCHGETLHFYTNEEEAPGTVIAVLSHHPLFNSTEGPATNFRLMKQFNSTSIHVQESDGQLSIKERIDREQICRRSPNCVLALDLFSYSKDAFKLITVKVEVSDINDNIPHFPHPEMHVDVSEAAVVGTRIPLQMAVDEDIGLNSIQDYLISGNSHFGLDVQTRADGLKYADLILMKELDRESQSLYRLELVASDGGSPPLSGSTTMIVRVLDFNDNTPTFQESSVTVDLMENAPTGHLIVDLSATDPDEGSNGEIVYGFTAQVSQEVRELLKIDPKSGGVILEGEVDFETKHSYEFDVQAQDLGPNPLTATCKVIVNIVDVNDNAPAITITPLTSYNHGVAYITEAATKDSLIALISTSDRDSGLNGKVHLNLFGQDHFKLQQANEGSFMIVTTSLLDRETIAEYNLTLVAEDLGFPSLKTIKKYTIRLTDENDNAPSFSKPMYEVSVPENNVPGAYITTISARDPDAGHNGKVSYRLLDAKIMGQSLSTFVVIDVDSGVLRAVRSLDYEKIRDFTLEIEAYDHGVPRHSTRSQLKIKITDQNDNHPMITYPLLDHGAVDILLPVKAPQNYLVFQMKATDADDGVNAQLSYTIQQDTHKLFTMNRGTGEVYLHRRLNPPPEKDLGIVVAVYDQGRPSLSCTATIRFTLTDATTSNIETVIMPPSEEEQRQLDLSIIFIAVLSGGCSLLLVAILVVACSCKRRADRSKQQPTGSAVESRERLHNPTTKSTECASSSPDSCHLSLNTETENLSVSSTREQGGELHSASSSSVSAPLCTPDWQQDRLSDGLSSLPETAKKGDSDFNDSASDTSGEGVRKGSEVPTQEQTESLCPEKSMAYHSTENQIIHQSNRSLYNGHYTIQYQKEYAMSYTAAAPYYSTYNPRAYNAQPIPYNTKDSYYHVHHQPTLREYERDLIYRSATLSPTRGHRDLRYNPEMSAQTYSSKVATAF